MLEYRPGVHFIKVSAPAFSRRRDYAPCLTWKVSPPSAKWMFDSVSMIVIENHAGADISRHYFWRKILSVIHASFWQIQVMKLKFVHAIKFWHGAVSMPAWNLLWNEPLDKIRLNCSRERDKQSLQWRDRFQWCDLKNYFLTCSFHSVYSDKI